MVINTAVEFRLGDQGLSVPMLLLFHYYTNCCPGYYIDAYLGQRYKDTRLKAREISRSCCLLFCSLKSSISVIGEGSVAISLEKIRNYYRSI